MRRITVESTRPDTGAPSNDHHSQSMLAYVIKAETPASTQVVDPFVELYGPGMAIAPPLDPERLLLLADECSAHGACLDAKADDTVGRGWVLEPVAGQGAGDAPPALDGDAPADAPADGQGPVSPDAPDAGTGVDAEEAAAALADTLARICPEYTFEEMLWQAQWERDAVGWAAWEVVRAGSDIGAIYPMPAQTLRATKDPDVYVQIVGGMVRYFKRFGFEGEVDGRNGDKVGTNGNRTSLRGARQVREVKGENAATEILMFKPYSSRSRYYAIPRWAAAIPAIAELTAIREFNVSFFGSGGVVDRLIHVKAGDPEQANKLADAIKEQIEEAEGDAHLSIVTGGGAESAISVDFLIPTAGRRDGQFPQRRQELTGEVLMAHKVPPYRVTIAIVGALSGSGPSREMLHTYRTGTIEPGQTILESRLNATLFGPKGINLRGFTWRLEDLDWDETELDLKIATEAVGSAIASPDEAREMIGLGATGEAAMQARYYQGVALGTPPPAAPSFGGKPAGGPPFGSRRALAPLEEFVDVARARLAAASTNGNGAGH